MGESVKYILDANIFIQAHRRYYSFDLVPAFWSFLVDAACTKECLRSIDKIYDELVEKRKEEPDDLAEWAHDEADFLFHSTNDSSVVAALRHIIRWAMENDQYKDEAKEEFADNTNADAWIIAYAKAHDFVIVTQETYEPDAKKKIKIPNVCEDFGVEYVNTFDVLRNLGFFVDSYSSEYLE